MKDDLITILKKINPEYNPKGNIITICCRCRKVDAGNGIWLNISENVYNSQLRLFSHGLCPYCASILYPEYYTKN